MKQVDLNAIPNASNKKEIELETVELKNVITSDGEQDIAVQVVPFDKRNDDHVDFAFAFIDMAGGGRSAFSNASEASRRYVELFMKHTVDDESNQNSDFNKVRKDLRAARTLFFQPNIQNALKDFFANA